ncbi:MAG: glycosyltransferase family 4 protein [bacterium]|nr:glycosyltransferase family 4 protein [bacterium]
MNKNVLFSTFDVFPLPKGSTTHIAQTIQALAEVFETTHLACLGGGDMPGFQKENNIIIRRCLNNHPNFLKRTEYFGQFLDSLLDNQNEAFDYFHFRDIWSGIPILEHEATGDALTIFEVNGLPSIELAYHYPGLLKNPGLLSRIKAMEDYCLEQADGILTVSQVNRRCLVERGADADKIIVTPNTAAPIPADGTGANTCEEDCDFILYVGTLAAWQGLPVLLEAFKLLAPSTDLKLVILGSTQKNSRPLRKIIRKWGLEDQVVLKTGLDRAQVYDYYRKACFSIAPLTRCSRNQQQGCSPLKIIESMAVGTPVIASRLPVCSEIITHDHDGLLVSPDSPRALARAINLMLEDTEKRSQLGKKAKKTISDTFNHEAWKIKLHDAYQQFSVRREKAYGRKNTAIKN